MKTKICSRSVGIVFPLACALVATSFNASGAVRLVDYHYPTQGNAIWLYDGNDRNGVPAQTRVTVVNTAYGLNMYTGRSPVVPYTETAMKLGFESGHYSNGTFANDSIYEDWSEYLGSGSAISTLGLDVGSVQTRYDGGWSYPETIDIGATSSASVDVYQNGAFARVAPASVEALDTLAVTVPAGTFSDCVHLRVSMGEGLLSQVYEMWLVRGVGMVKMQGVSGIGAQRLRQLVSTSVMPSIIVQPHVAASVAGQTVTLSVAANFCSPLSYQWKFNGVAIAGETSATCTIPSVQSFHAGNYSVDISGPVGGPVTSNVATLAVTAPPPSNARLLNLSTRAQALTGSDILIPGFVISGAATKRLLIRAVGPTLGGAPYNVPGTLANPRLALKRLDFSTNPPTYLDVAANDDWQTNANAAAITQTAADLFAFPFADAREAALLVDLAPGQYTVFADGVADATGIAIVELYDADAAAVNARLINISNRGFVGTGAQVMIPGFVVSSEGAKTLLVRVVGPTLAPPPYNVPGTMADPRLQLYRKETNGSDTLLLTQDDWGESPDAAFTASTATAVSAFALANGSADAAFVVTLPPGVYTVIGSAADGVSTGVVLVEVYVVP